MRERRLFMTLGIVLIVLVLGIAYAAVSTGLEITGSAAGEFDPNNFQVRFSKVSEVTGTKEVDTSESTAEIDSTDPTQGTFYFTGFKTKGQTQSATWTISNENDAKLYAYIEANTATEINRDYFKATCDLADDAIAPNETTTVTVTVECIKTPTNGTVSSGTMTFGFTATSSADEITGGEGDEPVTRPTVVLPTTNSYVGYYADLDRNGSVDGVIFVDQGYGQVGDGGWFNDDWGGYTITKIESGLKEYEITQESYTDDFGTAAVISPVEGTSGTDRFYVMKLDDFTTSSYSTFYWYYGAYDEATLDDAIDTSVSDFGEGYTKTGEVIAKWKLGEVSNGGYGAQNDRDIWKHIQTEYANGWFVPSKGEWSAFGGELGEASLDPALSTENYSDLYGLSDVYWSSSQSMESYAYAAMFSWRLHVRVGSLL